MRDGRRRMAVDRLVQAGAGSTAAAAWQLPALSGAIVTAWVLSAAVQLSGHAAVLHHHTLIEGGFPLGIALPFCLLGWQVMIAAMMLPASLPTIRRLSTGSAPPDARRVGLAAVLVPYVLVWSLFGVVAFLGDDVLHHIVDGSPWLAARPWLIEASVVGMAGAYQLTPFKRRWLEACRHPAALGSMETARSSRQLGLDHALACLGSSWALMLLMFAEGFANLWWMAALTAVMAYEASGSFGRRLASVVGVALVALGAAVLLASGGL